MASIVNKNIEIEQTFDDPLFVKNMILSALGQDPRHDFYSSTRTYKQDGCKNDIASKMITLFDMCSYRYKSLKGGNGSDDEEDNEVNIDDEKRLKLLEDNEEDTEEDTEEDIEEYNKKKEIISLNDEQFQVYAQNIVDDFTKDVTTAIFSDAISESIYAAGRLNQIITHDDEIITHDDEIDYESDNESKTSDNDSKTSDNDSKTSDNEINVYDNIESNNNSIHEEPLFYTNYFPTEANQIRLAAYVGGAVNNVSFYTITDGPSQQSIKLLPSENIVSEPILETITRIVDISNVAILNTYSDHVETNINTLETNLSNAIAVAVNNGELPPQLEKNVQIHLAYATTDTSFNTIPVVPNQLQSEY